ncbi:hypothetical protein [Photobacterium leiognathi]|uniref:hypothetical protein n=1 Tax=Photobacterium leiognathi TaxID=553611 RepID=UPI0029813175|nr:hypothetical protein [Photobacterium leiognathi]
MRQYPFLQKVVVEGEELRIEDVVSSAYIETADISGTKLIMELADQASYYRDDMKIGKQTELELTLADLSGGDEALWTDKFIVAKATSEGQNLKLECFQKDCHELKQLATQPLFFNEVKPSEIIAKLITGLKIECDEFSTLATYHLNAGGTKARLLRTLARDYGAVCFVSRGTFYFKDIRKLLAQEPAIKLDYSNPNAEFQINKYKLLGNDELYSRVTDRHYVRWNCVTGLQQSTNHQDRATTFVSLPGQAAINTQSTILMPVIQIDIMGYGAFIPSLICSLEFFKQLPDIAIDESLPKQAAISQITHYQKGYQYLCKMELGVLHE